MGREAALGMSRLVFREARPEDDAQLTQLIATPMPGDLSLSFTRQPSYLKACSQCGPTRRVLVALDGERVVALTSFFLREYWWDEQPRQVWTLSDFRALPERAGFGITGQGWKALRGMLGGHPAMLSVVGDNKRALALFSKPRPGWPRIRPIADLRTNLSPLLPLPAWASRRYTTRRLTQDELKAVIDEKPPLLGPLIEVGELGDLTAPSNQFWGVFEGHSGKLCGSAGLWNQSAFRQIRIHSYRGWYGRLSRLGQALRIPLLPPPGSEVPVCTASLLRCSDPAAWSVLLRRLKSEARRQGAKFLVWCREGSNPLNLSFAYPSRLYQVLWDDEKPLPTLAKPDHYPLGFEVAWL